MIHLPIGGDISIWGGESLNLEMRRLDNEITDLKSRSKVILFSSLKDLNLPETATLFDIAKRLPRNSMLQMSAYSSTHGSTLPLPYFSQAANPAYRSGELTAYKCSDEKKVHFRWQDEGAVAYCNINRHNNDTPTPWVFLPIPNMNYVNAGAGYWGNSISNIWVEGTYYFNSQQMSGFADKPTSYGAYVIVKNKDKLPTSDRIYYVIENHGSCRTYIRQNKKPWRYIPIVHLEPVTDSELRVGDMKVAGNGRLHMRLSNTIVGQLTYVGEALASAAEG